MTPRRAAGQNSIQPIRIVNEICNANFPDMCFLEAKPFEVQPWSILVVRTSNRNEILWIDKTTVEL